MVKLRQLTDLEEGVTPPPGKTKANGLFKPFSITLDIIVTLKSDVERYGGKTTSYRHYFLSITPCSTTVHADI